ncbi:hypothetical protein PP175_21635 [Aneurinibacillus sp. Ricciae_BoGa-3]|uniref:hypothetical protein n=1 Tax=Aneurinibacillus sp. Ricciae_BoGa-3 TaxID=3022697 RepID=UPI002341E157|nr:hypothetical protein [Aneurinibacillus sp. Ricciae_BoGa-3]WCK53893.1 hypothetical protein PP175_21635 [Aneurinibacillus sp. Ricciae_BoGa-3]
MRSKKAVKFSELNYSTITKCRCIKVSPHAFDEWNKRVGPFVSDRHTLEVLINKYLGEQERIELIGRNCMALDGEIVAGCEVDQYATSTIVIKSFFGRISQKTALFDFNYLNHFMTWQTIEGGRRTSKLINTIRKEGINLDLDQETLSQQKLPFFAEHIVKWKILGVWFRISYLGEGDLYEIKQLSGNAGNGQTIRVRAFAGLISLYNSVPPGTLSDAHITRLFIKILAYHKTIASDWKVVF